MLSNVYKDKTKTMQMEFLSTLSDNVKYIEHDEKSVHSQDVETLDYRQHRQLYHKLKAEEKQMLEIHFGSNPDQLRGTYLDMYERVHGKMIQTNRFDENSDLSTTYLGKTRMTRETDCQISLDTGASNSCMSKSFYLRCKSLHALLIFASNTQRIQAGNVHAMVNMWVYYL